MGIITAIATLCNVLSTYIPQIVTLFESYVKALHDSNAIASQQLAAQKAISTGDTSDLEKPLHQGQI